MSNLSAALKSILLTLTLNPSSQIVIAVTIALGVIAAWFSFGKITGALKFHMNTGGRRAASLAAFICVCLATAVLAKVYISPRLSNALLAQYMPLIIAVIFFLAAVLPLSCCLMKSQYLQTLSAFLVPILAAALIVFLSKGIMGAVKEGKKGFSSAKERTEGMNELLSK